MGQNNSQPQIPMNQPKKSRKKLIGVIVGVIIAIVIIIAIVGSTQTVNVTAVDLTIVYNGLTSGYLGPTSNSLPGFTNNAGSSFSYSITFTSSALTLTHSITSIYTTTPGFSILSESPNLPYSFSPGSTFTVTINIQAPSTAYNGVLQITVETS